MKKQNQSYAQTRIGFYENRFQNQNIQQLVDNFNQLANSRGWTAERSYYSTALINEILQRDIDISAIAVLDNENGQILSLHYTLVRYDEVSKSLVTFS